MAAKKSAYEVAPVGLQSVGDNNPSSRNIACEGANLQGLNWNTPS